MKKESKYVAFSTQKGGVGKTTLTVLVASYLHYVKGFNVAVVDCDYPQYSIVEMRKRDLKTVMEDEHYKLMAYRQFTTLGRKAYPVVSSTPEDAALVASQLTEQWVASNLRYPLEAQLKKISGKVYVQFSVNAKGKVCDVKVVRGIDPILDAEAVRVIKLSPLWEPAKQRGIKVMQQFTMPIAFAIN